MDNTFGCLGAKYADNGFKVFKPELSSPLKTKEVIYISASNGDVRFSLKAIEVLGNSGYVKVLFDIRNRMLIEKADPEDMNAFRMSFVKGMANRISSTMLCKEIIKRADVGKSVRCAGVSATPMENAIIFDLEKAESGGNK